MKKAGRPYNSTTPAWKSKPAIKVCAYRLMHYIEEKEATKYSCAKDLGMSRTTVIKWWDIVDWEGGDFDIFDHLFFCQAFNIEDSRYTLTDCADECGITLEKAQLMEEIRKEYVNMKGYKSKEYDMDRVKEVGLYDYYWTDGLYYDALRRNRKPIWKGKRRWKY